MLLPKFEYHEPASMTDMCGLMTEYGEAARPLAGGTDLLVNMKKNILKPNHLVSMGRLSEIKEISQTKTQLSIGAGVTISELGVSKTIETHVNALKCGALALGSPLIRNLATIGGNVGSARPAADTAPSLIAYGAKAKVCSSAGEKEIPVEELFKAPGITCLAPDEFISAFVIDLPQGYQGAGYINLGPRKAQDINIINVASYLALSQDGKTIDKARIVLGSVGPTPLRAFTAEKTLEGKVVDTALFEEAGAATQADCRPITDFRGSAEYRKEMVKVLTRRTLALALEDARGRC